MVFESFKIVPERGTVHGDGGKATILTRD